MILDLRKSICYYMTYSGKDGDPYFPEWRTNESGTAWENLIGMSWEDIDPPKGLVKDFKALVTPVATNDE